MFSDKEKVYIAFDRTNWFWGKAKIKVFMLSVVNRFIQCFGKECIQRILADREFANQSFIGWLNQNKINFNIRIKQSATVYINNKKYKPAGQLFAKLSPMEQQVLV